MNKINVRSPYHIYVNDTNLTSAKLDLYIYTGAQVGTMASITYTIDSTAYNESVTFEISELVRDYLDITFGGTYTSQALFVNYQVTKYISDVAQTPETIVQLVAFDGYGYFEEGVNPQLSTDVLISNDVIYKYDDAFLSIPVFADTNKTLTYKLGTDTVFTVDVTASTNTSTIIEYTKGLLGYYVDRVTADGGTIEYSTCFYSEINNYKVDTIEVNGRTFTVSQIDECKHTPYKLTFVNKFGALQNLWFFKRSNLALQTSDEKYKANILSNGSYSISSHQSRLLNKQGVEKLTLNSGFYPESYNEVFRQLLLSEKVWITYDSKVLPINITSSSFAFKTQLNDKLITYTLEVDFAFDKINSVR